jgi:1-acyl-sn-glycerol-3-phosphate acyltransferase
MWRSTLFNILFYINIVLWLVLTSPALVMPRAVCVGVMRSWAKSTLWLLRVCVNIDVSWHGSIPQGGVLVACKHQSLWETFALSAVIDDPAYMLKRDLLWIPFFGWFAWKLGMIAVDRRQQTPKDFKRLVAGVRQALAQNRPVVIFPEGTRTMPGSPPQYKAGVALLYGQLSVPCVPVSLNSGLFWPRRQWWKSPGVIDVVFREAIPSGLPKTTFLPLLQERIEERIEQPYAAETPAAASATAR